MLLLSTVRVVRFVQPEKGLPCNWLILAGRLIVVKPVQPPKAPLPILVTPSGMVTLVRPPATHTRVFGLSFVYMVLPVLPYLVLPLSTVRVVRLVQPEKGLLVKSLILVGSSTSVKPVQPLKAPPSILATWFGMVMFVRLLQF